MFDLTMTLSQCITVSLILLSAVSGAAHKTIRGGEATKDDVRKLQTCGINNPELVVAIFADEFPSDVSWSLTEVDGPEILSADLDSTSGSYSTHFESACLEPNTCYNFVINDEFDDGLTQGNNGFNSNTNLGFYSLTLDGKVITAGKDYDSEDLFDFCLNEEGTYVAQTCTDAYQKVELHVAPTYDAHEVGYTVDYLINGWEIGPELISVAAGSSNTPFYPQFHSGCLPRPIFEPECLRFTVTGDVGNGQILPYTTDYSGYDIFMDDEITYSGGNWGSGTEELFCADTLDASEYDCMAEYAVSFTWRYGLTTQRCDNWLVEKLEEYPKFCVAYALEPNMQLRDLCPGVCQKVCDGSELD